VVPRARRLHGEGGDTLVEVLMAVVVVGIAFVGILMGLGTSIRLSGTHRGQSSADVVLVSAADSVKSQTYVPCPGVTTSSYNPTSGVTLPSGWSASNVTITAVKGWNGSTFGTCPATDQDLQLITIRAMSPDNQASVETIDVVKRDPA
jgi:Tfp pilus assembly protein PilV